MHRHGVNGACRARTEARPHAQSKAFRHTDMDCTVRLCILPLSHTGAVFVITLLRRADLHRQFTVKCPGHGRCDHHQRAKLHIAQLSCRSKEWGVLPWHWYWTSALPRGLLASLPLSVAGAALEPKIRAHAAAIASFVMLYSCLGHKEVRIDRAPV